MAILENIVFVLCALHAMSYTLSWWWSDRAVVINSIQVLGVFLLWGVVIYFAYFSEVSKFHMLWAYPTALFGAAILGGYAYRVILNVTKK